MYFRKSAAVLLTAVMAAGLVGCGQRYGGYDYVDTEIRERQIVCQAIVTDVQQVNIREAKSSYSQTFGGLVGAVAGGVVGSTIGNGTGRTLTSLGGALLGGAVGTGAGNAASQTTGLQITVLYDSGEEEVIVQGMEPAVTVGQRVRVITSSDSACRIQPIL